MNIGLKAYLKVLKNIGMTILSVSPYDAHKVAIRTSQGYILVNVGEKVTLALCEEIEEELGLSKQSNLKSKFDKFFKRKQDDS